MTADVPEHTRSLVRNEEFLLYVGAVSRRKGVKTAIDLAQISDLPIVVAGPLLAWTSRHLPDTAQYFQENVLPRVDNERVHYLPAVDTDDRNVLMSSALAAVVASAHEDPTWQEPFGRVIPETLAADRPVIASSFMKGAAEVPDSPYVSRFCLPEDGIDRLSLRAVEQGRCRSQAERLFGITRYAADLMCILSYLHDQ